MTSAHVEFYKGKIVGVFLVVFICGMAAGGVGMKAYIDHAEPQPTAVELDRTREVMGRLKAELHLDDNQFSQVRGVLDECIMYEADMLSQIETLRSDGRTRIEKILDDEQRKTFRTVFIEPSDEQ
jgi:hypothetical protein